MGQLIVVQAPADGTGVAIDGAVQVAARPTAGTLNGNGSIRGSAFDGTFAYWVLNDGYLWKYRPSTDVWTQLVQVWATGSPETSCVTCDGNNVFIASTVAFRIYHISSGALRSLTIPSGFSLRSVMWDGGQYIYAGGIRTSYSQYRFDLLAETWELRGADVVSPLGFLGYTFVGDHGYFLASNPQMYQVANDGTGLVSVATPTGSLNIMGVSNTDIISIGSITGTPYYLRYNSGTNSWAVQSVLPVVPTTGCFSCYTVPLNRAYTWTMPNGDPISEPLDLGGMGPGGSGTVQIRLTAVLASPATVVKAPGDQGDWGALVSIDDVTYAPTLALGTLAPGDFIDLYVKEFAESPSTPGERHWSLLATHS